MVTAIAKVRARLVELEAVRANYLGYLQCRIGESDWHGAWDASVNISETECEMAGLEFALAAMETPEPAPAKPQRPVCGMAVKSFGDLQSHPCTQGILAGQGRSVG